MRADPRLLVDLRAGVPQQDHAGHVAAQRRPAREEVDTRLQFRTSVMTLDADSSMSVLTTKRPSRDTS
jgi:hypothetical protein